MADHSTLCFLQRLDVLQFPLTGPRLIEASAGTGKTYTIATLYVRLLLGHGVPGFSPAEEPSGTEVEELQNPPFVKGGLGGISADTEGLSEIPPHPSLQMGGKPLD